MTIGAPLPLDHDHSQIQPPAEVRSAESLGVPKGLEIDPKNPIFILRKKVSGSVGGIIHVAERGAVSQSTAQKTAELKVQQEGKETVAESYQSLHTEVDRDFVISKLDDILKRPRKRFLESHVSSMYNGKFDSENNIVLGGTKVVKKGSPEYNSIIIGSLESMRLVVHAMLRKSEADGVDPKEIRKNFLKYVDGDGHERYRQMHTVIDNELTFGNIDIILKTPRKSFLEAHIYGLFKGKFDNEGNIVIEGKKVVRKGNSEYKVMIEAGLKEFRELMHALVKDAEKDGVDPNLLQ